MKLLDGKEVAAFHRSRIERRIAALQKGHIQPKLVILLAGGDKPSAMYAASMQKTARSVGLQADMYQYEAAVQEAELIARIEQCNADSSVFGILLMMPLPPHLDAQRVVNAIRPDKDADGLTDCNVARLFTGRPAFVPCTPQAVMAILDYYGVELAGKEVVVIGRSAVVGKPLAQLCLSRNATVTQCHTGTADLKAVTRRGDVVIAAVGKAGLVTADMIKPGAVVIDVGINRVDGKTVGDVAFDEVAGVAGAVTPVPGGVGAVTTMMVLANVIGGTAYSM